MGRPLEVTAYHRSGDRAVLYIFYYWRLSDEELEERNLNFYTGQSRMVTGYGRYGAEEDRSIRLAGMIEFGESFVEELVRRKLFDIDWNNVRRKIFSKPPEANSAVSFK